MRERDRQSLSSLQGAPATGDLAAVAELCAAPQGAGRNCASANSALSASASATLPQHEGTATRQDEVSSELIDGFLPRS